MNYSEKIINDIELHSVEGIRECFINGVSPNDKYKNAPLIYKLIGEYTRTPRFKDCVQAFVDHGLQFEDKALLAVLLDDAGALYILLTDDPGLLTKSYTLPCAYTPLFEVSLLHICAEFNHLSCAEVLVNHGAGIDVTAGFDEHGFGGHTPIFHTVNQNGNRSVDMLHFLLSKGSNLTLAVKGLIWGKGYEWETLIPAVTPVSYAMMGLLPQMHRDETTISNLVRLLLKVAYGIQYEAQNIPNAYLKGG
ncbi:MAG TPA: ankyrin repeat domain-containing protein [Chitinophagaceae bacterium]|nr:ankyrin repeat domain-containing protein [Chitinophagaceae bacterium]